MEAVLWIFRIVHATLNPFFFESSIRIIAVYEYHFAPNASRLAANLFIFHFWFTLFQGI